VRLPEADGLAVLRYETPEYVVVCPGRYVLCAVSGRRIPLEHLLYWSVELQEAYAGPGEAMQRLGGLKPPARRP
jgi:hypothetical protein